MSENTLRKEIEADYNRSLFDEHVTGTPTFYINEERYTGRPTSRACWLRSSKQTLKDAFDFRRKLAACEASSDGYIEMPVAEAANKSQ